MVWFNFSRKGFTLIELMVVIAILAIITTGVLVLTRNNVNKIDIEGAAEVVASSLTTAQSYARSGAGDSTWGVKTNNGQVVIFKGADYAGRDTNYDQKHELNNVVFTGVTEVVFSKMYGLPNVTGNIILTRVNESKTITINSKGVVQR